MHEDRWNEPCGYTVCGERFDTLEQARRQSTATAWARTIPVRKHYLRAFEKAWVRFPYPLVVILAYLLLGIFNGAWGMGLFLFFTIPLYYMAGPCHRPQAALRRSCRARTPSAVVAWFCFMAFVLNQPHPAWVAFLTIPLVEWLAWSARRTGGADRKRRKASAENEPIEVDAQ